MKPQNSDFNYIYILYYQSNIYYYLTPSCTSFPDILELIQMSTHNIRFSGEIQKIVSNYRNGPKFSDRQVWANSADLDQIAPRGAVWSGSTLFVIASASFGLITLW